MSQQVRKTSFLPQEKKDTNAFSPLVPIKDKIGDVNNPITPGAVPRAPRPYRMPGMDLAGPETNAFKTHAANTMPAVRKKAMPAPAVDSQYDQYIKDFHKTGDRKHLVNARRYAMADYAYRYPDYPEEAEAKKNLRITALDALEKSHPSLLKRWLMVITEL